ncbi:phage integrase N-terminal SAM-like domain-containing protein [Microbacterium sp.]|uniref:tyrosine-type recombinase/integrase n=1 Tax=Microbacterium sp. TaxID=51671 RepID=UPI003241E7C9
MHREEWEGIAQQFYSHRKYAPGTLETYGLAIRQFFDWCEGQGIDPDQATTGQLLLYRESVRRRLSPNTANSRFKIVRTFYMYLARTGRVQSNPIELIQPMRIGLAPRDKFTIEELGRIWDASEGRDRVVIGLLALCSLSREEVRTMRAEDLQDRNGTLTVNVRGRRGANDLGYVSIPAQLATEIVKFLGGRRTGYVLQGTGQSRLMSKTFVNAVVRRVARKADLGYHFTTLALTEALRTLAIEYRFSYASVLRTTTHGSSTRRTELVKNLELPPEEQASIRLGKLLAVRDSEVDLHLLQAESLLTDKAQHPASSVMLACATFEKVLRDFATSRGILITKKDPTLSTYGTALRGADLLSLGQLRTIERMLTYRNDAAHGWFGSVGPVEAEWVLREVRDLTSQLQERDIG